MIFKKIDLLTKIMARIITEYIRKRGIKHPAKNKVEDNLSSEKILPSVSLLWDRKTPKRRERS
jgi:hypothetical protein